MKRPTVIDGSAKGYVRLHRRILDHPLFREKPEGWFKIWIYILLRANWRDSVFHSRRGESIAVPAGSLITSLEKLGTHTALSKEHARRALDYLERTQSVTLLRTHHWTMITIVNWAGYQQSDDEGHHTEHHAPPHTEFSNATRETPHQTPRSATPSKEEKNLDKKYTSNSNELDACESGEPQRTKPAPSKRVAAIDPEIRQWFESEFWPVYPRHEGKQPALRAATAKATTPEIRAMYLARLKAQLPAYLERKAQSGQRVIPMAATWFNQDRAEDELSPAPQQSREQNAVAHSDYPAYVPLSRAG
jgi:hypothetical protein